MVAVVVVAVVSIDDDSSSIGGNTGLLLAIKGVVGSPFPIAKAGTIVVSAAAAAPPPIPPPMGGGNEPMADSAVPKDGRLLLTETATLLTAPVFEVEEVGVGGTTIPPGTGTKLAVIGAALAKGMDDETVVAVVAAAVVVADTVLAKGTDDGSVTAVVIVVVAVAGEISGVAIVTATVGLPVATLPVGFFVGGPPVPIELLATVVVDDGSNTKDISLISISPPDAVNAR